STVTLCVATSFPTRRSSDLIDYNGRLCMVSAAAGNNKAFGVDRAANPWADIPLAEVLVLAGANCAETFPVLNKYLWQQRDNGGRSEEHTSELQSRFDLVCRV